MAVACSACAVCGDREGAWAALSVPGDLGLPHAGLAWAPGGSAPVLLWLCHGECPSQVAQSGRPGLGVGAGSACCCVSLLPRNWARVARTPAGLGETGPCRGSGGGPISCSLGWDKEKTLHRQEPRVPHREAPSLAAAWGPWCDSPSDPKPGPGSPGRRALGAGCPVLYVRSGSSSSSRDLGVQSHGPAWPGPSRGGAPSQASDGGGLCMGGCNRQCREWRL